jgi:hypothetical protein
VALAEVKDDLSKYLRLAADEEIVTLGFLNLVQALVSWLIACCSVAGARQDCEMRSGHQAARC